VIFTKSSTMAQMRHICRGSHGGAREGRAFTHEALRLIPSCGPFGGTGHGFGIAPHRRHLSDDILALTVSNAFERDGTVPGLSTTSTPSPTAVLDVEHSTPVRTHGDPGLQPTSSPSPHPRQAFAERRQEHHTPPEWLDPLLMIHPQGDDPPL
jgi:hypothetical protein